MAVTYLAVMYRDGKEIDRWPAVLTHPNPKYWTSLDILLMKSGSYDFWYKGGNEWWRHLTAAEVPKHLRLLALLE